MQCQMIRLEKRPDFRRAPANDLLENRDEDAERIVAQHSALGNSGKQAIFGYSNRKPIAVVYIL